MYTKMAHLTWLVSVKRNHYRHIKIYAILTVVVPGLGPGGGNNHMYLPPMLEQSALLNLAYRSGSRQWVRRWHPKKSCYFWIGAWQRVCACRVFIGLFVSLKSRMRVSPICCVFRQFTAHVQLGGLKLFLHACVRSACVMMLGFPSKWIQKINRYGSTQPSVELSWLYTSQTKYHVNIQTVHKDQQALFIQRLLLLLFLASCKESNQHAAC